MFRGGAILGLAAGIIAFGNAGISVLGATDPAVNPTENVSRGFADAEHASVAPVNPGLNQRPAVRPPLRGNPLWVIPIRTLSVTRERPIFSPSRRPPAPAVVAAPYVLSATPPPPKPEEPDHPLLALVGTVVGETESIGVFFDQTGKSVFSLRTGQDFTGWILRSVQGREAIFQKGSRTAVLALPDSASHD